MSGVNHSIDFLIIFSFEKNYESLEFTIFLYILSHYFPVINKVLTSGIHFILHINTFKIQNHCICIHYIIDICI